MKFLNLFLLVVFNSMIFIIPTFSSYIINNLNNNINQKTLNDIVINETSSPVIYKSKNSDRFSNITIIDPLVIDNVTNADNNIKYIQHTASITKSFKDYKWSYDGQINKWRLLIDDSPYSVRYAKNGFYEINGDIYYFDENEYMVKGIIIDTMNIKYTFNDDGKLISKEFINVN